MNRFVDGNKLNLYLIAVLEQFLYAHPEANEWEKLQFSKKAEAYFYKREEEEQDRRVLKLLRGAFDYRDWETDRKSTRLNSSHITRSRMPSSA